MTLSKSDFQKIDWVNNFELKNNDFFAQDIYRIFGRFSPETFLIQLDDWLNNQARTHEFFHLFQCIFLPAPYFYGKVKRQHLELETIFLLKAFDQKISFELNTHSEMTDILKNKNLLLDQEFFDNYKSSLGKNQFYSKVWKHEVEGISLHYITESMAHIASMQLSDTPDIDTLNLTGDEYNLPYQYFLKFLDHPDDIDIRFRYLLFLYICYFSLLVVDEYESKNEVESVSAKTFTFLCSQAQSFIEASERYKLMFNKYSRSALVDYDKWEIAHYLKDVSDQKISSVYAFFETISFIEKRANTFRAPQNFSDSFRNSDWVELITQNEFSLDNSLLLAKIIIFRVEFEKLPDMYDRFMNIVSKDRHFTYEDESQFYFFIQQIKNLFRDGALMHCCEEHDYLQDENKFLRCEDEDSSASRIKRLAKKEAYDVFLM